MSAGLLGNYVDRGGNKVYSRGMTNTQNITREIWFTTDRNGRKRAYYWSFRAFRSLPMPLAEAELMIATGEAAQIAGNPFKPVR